MQKKKTFSWTPPVCPPWGRDGRWRWGRGLCLPVPAGVAQPQFYWLLISQLWRPGKRERESDVWTFVRFILISHEYLTVLAFLHTSFHHSSQTLEHSDRYKKWLLLFPYGLSVSSIYVIPAACKMGATSARLRLFFIQSNAESSSATNKVNDHYSLKVMTKHHAYIPRKIHLSLLLAISHMHTHQHNVYHVEIYQYL